ncbi:MAG TPA: GvpL/GvpF family gas vesicle protein [Kofleriaceae bacterium]|nr:GvpL/GvpF family gas vesicle protein [Kofleriaceae bacterium]
MTPARGLYLYAVVPHDARIGDVRGIAGEPVELLQHAQLGLVAGEVAVERLAGLNDESAAPELLGALARCHDDVVRTAWAAAGVVLPFRLGTVLVDRDAARRYLDDRAEELYPAMQQVTACHEWGVTVHDRATEVPAQANPSGPHDPGRPGTAYLARRRQEVARAEARRQAMSHVEGELRARAIDVAAGRTRQPDVVLDASYLVRCDREPAFFEAVDRCGDLLLEQGLQLQLRGPWPPYSFALREADRD